MDNLTRVQKANLQLQQWEKEDSKNPPAPRKFSLADIQEIAENNGWDD